MRADRIAPDIGSVLHGVRLSARPDPCVISTIRAAIAHRLVLVLPDQDLSAAALRDFTSRLGPLFVHHDDEGVLTADGFADVLEMRKEPDGDRLFGDGGSHADVTFRKPAGHLSVLHAKVIPPLGGDTGFASTITAFEGHRWHGRPSNRLDRDPRAGRVSRTDTEHVVQITLASRCN